MLDRLADLEREFETVEARLADPVVIGDRSQLETYSRRYKELGEVVEAFRRYRSAADDLEVARAMWADSSGDDREMLRDEIDTAEATIADLDGRLKVLLLPKDPFAGRNVIMEIRGAEGGEEANLFARDLFEMYRAYLARVGLGVEVMSSSPSDMGGLSDVTVLVKGDQAWTTLKHEGGPHRVQRVPVTESQGRVHTSSATVSVVPEADEVEVEIRDEDLTIQVYRSSGPGGQSVNTTDSAVRVTHKPTGLVVAMQDEKSQLQNKAKALQVLRSRLAKAEHDRKTAELSDQRKGQIGGGGRSEKIRTYNFKENRVTDHRIGLTIYKLDKVLAGELDEVVDALVAHERAEQLAAGE